MYIKLKINQIQEYQNPLSPDSQTGSNSGADVIIVIDAANRPAWGSIGIGNPILIEHAPLIMNYGAIGVLGNINGYHVVADIKADTTGKIGSIYLITGKPMYGNGVPETIIKGSDITIDARPNTPEVIDNMYWGNGNAPAVNSAMSQMAGKIENCRRIYNWFKKDVIPNAEALIKEPQNIGEYAGIVDDLDFMMWYAEGAYNRAAGLRDTNNGYWQQKNLQNVSNVYKRAAGAMNGAEKVFLDKERRMEDFMKVTLGEKLWNAVKTAGLAPLRAAMLVMIKNNIAGTGVALYGMKKQNPTKYENAKNNFLKISGQRTNFDSAVEMNKKKFEKKENGADGDMSFNTDALFGRHTANSVFNAEGDDPAETAGLDQATIDQLKQAAQDSASTKTLKLPVGVGAAVAGAVTAATGGSAAPYAVSIGGFYEVVAATVNGANIKIGKGKPGETVPEPGETVPEDGGGELPPDPEPESNPLKTVGIIAGIGIGIGLAIWGISTLVKKSKSK